MADKTQSIEQTKVDRMIEKFNAVNNGEKKSIFKMYLKNPVGSPYNVVTGLYYRGSNRFWLRLLGVSRTITENQLTALNDHKTKFNPKADEFSDDKFIIKKGKDKGKVDKKAQWKAISIARRKAYKKYEQETGTLLPKPKLFPVIKNGEQVYEDGKPKMCYHRYPVKFNKIEQSRDRETKELLFNDDGTPKMYWLNIWYDVFDLKDIENWNDNEPIPEEIKFVDNINAESAIRAYTDKEGVTIKHYNEDIVSCYVPPLDEIRMSNKERFVGEIAYYSTLLHEVGHSTGAKDRRNRIGVVKTKDSTRTLDVYAFEELRAQFFSMFAQEFFGIDGDFVNDAAYVDSWWISKDPKKLIRACDQAYSDCEWFFKFSNININPSEITDVEDVNKEEVA